MKGDTKVIRLLNELLKEELSSINQYFLHARMLLNWGYKKIGDKVMASAIDEMKHARTYADRILFLEGAPNVQNLSKLTIGGDIVEMLTNDLEREATGIDFLKNAIGTCYDTKDHGTREILEHILEDEEEHLDWLEAQLEIIKTCGVENYLTKQLE